MFPADAIMASYVEDQNAAYEARRLALEKTASKTPTEVSSSASTSPTVTRPSTPAFSKQNQKSVGVLGNLWQGFFKLPAPNTTISASSSVASTPAMEKSEQEAYAERMRDIDICAMRAW